MSEKLFEAKTVEEALQQAAEEFGVAASELEHEVVEEKTDDFWGLGNNVVVVKAWAAGQEVAPEPEPEPEPVAEPAPAPAPEMAAEPVAAPPVAPFFAEPAQDAPVASDVQATPEPETQPEPVPAAAPETAAVEQADAGEPAPVPVAAQAAADDDSGDLAELTVALLGRIFGHMDFECTAQSRIDGDTLQVAIAGADVEYLLDGRGRGLSALELILNHGFRHRTDRDRLKIRVDAGDFRSKRDDELRDIAYQVSHQAKETGTEQLTKPLNPYERRIIHLTLADDGAVSTRSQGTGFLKAVSVIPERRR